MNQPLNTSKAAPSVAGRPMPRSWFVLIVFNILAVAFTFAAANQPTTSAALPTSARIVLNSANPEFPDDADSTDQTLNLMQFTAIDVVIDPQDNPLAAWQLELYAPEDGIRFVGIEGGEHPAYADPAFYDPQALQNDELLLADYSTRDELPRSAGRVARVHLQVTGFDKPCIANLIATANPRGIEFASGIYLDESLLSDRPGTSENTDPAAER